jgi:hypothetical protein
VRYLRIVALCLVCCPAAAEERLRVADNSSEVAVKDAIISTARAFDSEDVGSYGMCFKESRRPHIRRKVALLFADAKCSMEIIDLHVISIEEAAASVAVKYKMVGVGAPSEFLSEIHMVKEKDRWVIDKESVRSSSASRSSVGSTLAAQAPQGQRGMAVPGAWDEFDPDTDLISPNLKHLSGDIGIREGFGCANGRCANGRCER